MSHPTLPGCIVYHFKLYYFNTLSENSLHLVWGGEGEHHGEVPTSFLVQNDYSPEALNRRYENSRLDENCWTKVRQ